MYLKTTKQFILLCILFSLLIDFAKVKGCHKIFTQQKPTGELLCDTFKDVLIFNETIDEDVGLLDLSKNNITVINEASFVKPYKGIFQIYLDNNKITTIDSNAFKNLPDLEQIDMSNNNITFIHSDAFASNKKLKFIDLKGNNIQRLDIEMVKKLNSLKELGLSDNPLNVCDRKTAEVLDYLDKRHITTYFLESCNGLMEEETADVVTRIPPVPTSENYLLIFAVLGALLSLAVIMSILVIILSFRIFRKKKIGKSRKPRTISGNYLLANQRLSAASQDKDGYLIPTFRNPPTQVAEDAPLIMDNGLLRRMSVNTESSYNGSHIYVEIEEPSS